MKNYESKWADYPRKQHTFYTLFITFVPGNIIIGFLFEEFFKTEKSMMFFAIAWMVATAIAGIRLSMWKCPRCDKYFHSSWRFRNPWTQKCLNCGLPKWADKETP